MKIKVFTISEEILKQLEDKVDFEINNNRDLDYALELILNSINYINNH